MSAPKTVRLICTVAGVPTTIYAADVQHGVDQPVGTATLTLPVPLATAVALNATVNVQAGYDETGLATIFTGRIVKLHQEFTDSGPVASVDCTGWASLLAFPDNADLIYYNSSSLYGIFRSLCTRRGVPAFHADYIRYQDGITDVRFGGNPLVDGGNVIIPRDSSPLDWLVTKATEYGYRLFDTPAGVLTEQLVNGAPPPAADTYVEAVDLLSLQHEDDVSTMATYVEVLGARYTDDSGVNVAIRSIPAAVPYSAVLDPPGYRKIQINDSGIVSQSLADAARNAAEVQYGAPGIAESFEIEAAPTLQPGMAVQVTSATLGINADRWLMGIHQTVDDGGYWMTIDTWTPGGTALPAGNDAVNVFVAAGPIHLGDEYISNYAHPSPQGTVYRIPVTVPDTYTSMVLTVTLHGTNSYMLDGANADSTVSEVQAWQGGKKLGSSQLPVLAENYDEHLDYTNPAYWSTQRIPIPGSPAAGAMEVWLVSGQDSRLPDSTKFDDWEAENLTLTLAGVGMPVLPGEA